MIKFIYSILGLIVCSYLVSCQTRTNQAIQTNHQSELNQVIQSKIAELKNYRGIKILDEGPAGRKHFNSYRGEFGCSKFRITIYNDTIFPIELKVKFPSQPVSSLPDSLVKVQYWILPDSLTPNSFLNARDFGITGIEDHFNSDFTAPGFVKAMIQPREHYTFYVAGMGKGPFGRGSSYSKLFINRQNIDVPYLQGKSLKMDNIDSNSFDLVWGIGHTPHNLYTLIPCGQIDFLK